MRKQKAEHVSSTLQKGEELIAKAQASEISGDYNAALEHYRLALGFFETARKYEKVESRKKAIAERMAEHMTRAEEVKKLAAESGNAAGGVGQASKPGAKGAASTQDMDKVVLGDIMVTNSPDISFDDIAGLKVAKDALEEALIFPRRFPLMYANGLEPWKGILFYGPPGTGKTQLARAVASEIQSTFISISSSDLFSRWQGVSEKVVKEVFTLARAKRPSVIFIDEIDAILSDRKDSGNESSARVKTEFMQQMDGLKSDTDNSGGVMVLGATNLPWELDQAIRRRFHKRIFIPLPDVEARAAIVKIRLKKVKNTLSDVQCMEVARRTEGFSGADLSTVVNSATYASTVRKYKDATHFKPHAEDETKWVPCSSDDKDGKPMTWRDLTNEQIVVSPVSLADFETVLPNSRPSVGVDSHERYEEWTIKFGEAD